MEIPKLVSHDLEFHMREQFLYFNLYYRMNQEEVISVFKSFPYLFCLAPEKVRYHLE